MSFPISAFSSALQGLARFGRRVDRDAAAISRAGLETSSGPSSPSLAPDTLDLTGASVDLVASRTFYTAQLRVIETADEMTKESIDLLGPHRGEGA